MAGAGARRHAFDGAIFRAIVALLLASSLPAQEFGPWFAVGPFDEPEGASQIASPHPPERGMKSMEAGAEGPDLRATFKGKGGRTVAWVPVVREKGGGSDFDVGTIDFGKVLPAPSGVEHWGDFVAAYLYRRIDAAEEMEITAALGSDDSLRVWLNGELLVERDFPRILLLQDHEQRLRLRRGANHLLVKVGNEKAAWTFRMAPWKGIPKEKIRASVERGIRWLLQYQLLDGTWGAFEEWGAGHPAFAAYTLLSLGVRRDHPAVEMAIRAAEEREIEKTYAASCVILALERLRDPAREALLLGTVEDLLSWQDSTGLFSYPVYLDGDRPAPDLSNTLFAALAVRAAARAGVSIPEEVWLDLADGTLRCLDRNPPGPSVTGGVRPAGFSYRVDGEPTGSTTAGALSILAIAEEGMKGHLPGPLRVRIEPARAAALAWLERNMRWSTNPDRRHGVGHHYWFIYGVERVGALLGLERLGGLDWYENGADYLVGAQKGDGSWGTTTAIETPLALLFLGKATAASTTGKGSEVETWGTDAPKAEVAIRARGGPPAAVWIERIREDLLEARRAKESGLDVAKVEFWGRLKGKEATLLGELPGAQVSAEGIRRFELQHRFPRRGTWEVWAKVFLRAPAGESERVLESPPLPIPVEEVLEPERLAYPGDFRRNLLRGIEPRAEASSFASAPQKPEMAADGKLGTAWFCTAKDGSPWLRLAFSPSIRADRVLLSHGRPRLASAKEARIARAEVILNGDRRFEVEMNPDVLLKTVLPFGKPLAVQRLEIRILEAIDGRVGGNELGFSEVELQASAGEKVDEREGRR
ncbi:MAG: hypothetical protein L0323_22510 [Planctomycetes bacterium]|nr:hypothetical protein [Planctomycetota bacterium]